MHSFFGDIAARFPLIQAPMAGAQDEVLAIAVAQAGGIGSIPCATLTPKEVHKAARQFQGAAPGPLSLNFFCHKAPEPDPYREARWQQELNKYYVDLSITPSAPGNTHPRAFSAEMVDVVCDIKPQVVSFHFGLPKAEYLERIRSTNAKVIATATTVAEAAFLQNNGCDAVIAQGQEAGGHQGVFLPSKIEDRQSTSDLVKRIVNAVGIPVIAAGDIADQGAIKAMMAAGASGVQIGTRFLKSPESKISPIHRAILEGEEDRATTITNVFTGRPARSLVNKLVRELGPMNANVPAYPLAISALQPLRAATKGREDFVSLWAGENWKTGEPKPAGEIVKELGQAFVQGF